MTRYQHAKRPADSAAVVSIADLALLSCSDDPMRTTEAVVAAVRADWPFEVGAVREEAGTGVEIDFADGSLAFFTAWR